MQVSAVQKFTAIDFPGRTACIVFTAGCNFRCGFCHNPEFVLPDRVRELRDHFIPLDALWGFLEMRQELLDGVVISGGEPTLQHGLEEALVRIRGMGFQTKLDTNGSLPEILEPLLKKGLVDYVAMDVKTSLERYPELVSSCVRPDAISRSIELVKTQAREYEFRTTVMREHHTPEIMEEIRKLVAGSRRYALQGFRSGQTLDPAYESYATVTRGELESMAPLFHPVVQEVIIRA